MTYLDCSVTGCVYNENHCCCKREIVVEGKDAKENRGTFCGSFKERKAESAGNSVGNPSKNIEVSCEVCHCRFNENKKCSAEHIGIAGHNASVSGDTECASFESKI